MIKILVGSKNPVKIDAAKEAFLKYYDEVEAVGISVNSDVSDQPRNEEVYNGARNRIGHLKEINKSENLNADFFVGIEGGIEHKFDRWFSFGCMCIHDKNGNESFGTSPHFELPEEVLQRLLKREELGHVMDEIMQAENSKQKGGAIGFFTNGKMTRKELYFPGLLAALVPFNHPEMFFKK